MEPPPPFSKEAQSLKPGIYKHFRRNKIRTPARFIEKIKQNDTYVKRFKYLGK